VDLDSGLVDKRKILIPGACGRCSQQRHPRDSKEAKAIDLIMVVLFFMQCNFPSLSQYLRC
jgi:hypothetical protein